MCQILEHLFWGQWRLIFKFDAWVGQFKNGLFCPAAREFEDIEHANFQSSNECARNYSGNNNSNG